MNAAFEVGAAALRADQRALEIHANNVANVNTPAFKRTDARFSEVLSRQVNAADGADVSANGLAPEGGGVRVVPQTTLFSQGSLKPTGNALDLAIDGLGLIELIGASGDPVLWRGGTLRVNEDGLLATSSGLPLRVGIIVPQDAEALTIAPDGVVSVRTATEEAFEIGQIGLVRTDHEGGLERLDNGLFRAAAETRLIDARPGEDGVGALVQGSIEESNVELTAEMVGMLMIQRAFAANAQIVQAADQIAAITNNLKG